MPLADNLHGAAIEELKNQLLVVFLKRLTKPGEELVIPVSEIDATGQDLVAMRLIGDPRVGATSFGFTVSKKS
jgi:hypothetical protein